MILKFKGYLVFDQPVYIALATTQVLYNLWIVELECIVC